MISGIDEYLKILRLRWHEQMMLRGYKYVVQLFLESVTYATLFETDENQTNSLIPL